MKVFGLSSSFYNRNASYEINGGAWDVKGEYEDTMHASGGSCSAGAGRENMGGRRDSRLKAFGIDEYTTVMLRREDGFDRMVPSKTASVQRGYNWTLSDNSFYDDIPMQKVWVEGETKMS